MADTVSRYWTEDEMKTWACDDDPYVHMFPGGPVPGTAAACGQVRMRENVVADECGPIHAWGNGNADNVLCNECLDLWWNGPGTRGVRAPGKRFTDAWAVHHNGDTIHLTSESTRTQAACGEGRLYDWHNTLKNLVDARSNVGLSVDVCHPCAVIWDAQCARDEGMGEDEGRGWGYAEGDHSRLHRFWCLDLSGGTAELSHCAPYLMPRINGNGGSGTLDEWVDPVIPPCPTCLTATDTPTPETPEDSDAASVAAYQAEVKEKAQAVCRAAQKAVQTRRSPAATWMVTAIRNSLLKAFDVDARMDEVSSRIEARAVYTETASALIRHYLGQYRAEIATELDQHADERDAMGALMDAEDQNGAPDRRAATCYRDAARRVRLWPTLGEST